MSNKTFQSMICSPLFTKDDIRRIKDIASVLDKYDISFYNAYVNGTPPKDLTHDKAERLRLYSGDLGYVVEAEFIVVVYDGVDPGTFHEMGVKVGYELYKRRLNSPKDMTSDFLYLLDFFPNIILYMEDTSIPLNLMERQSARRLARNKEQFDAIIKEYKKTGTIEICDEDFEGLTIQ